MASVRFPKTRRAQKQARYRRLRPDVRRAAFILDSSRCVWPTCRRVLMLETDSVHALAHGHEVHGRATDDPCDVNVVVTVCSRCHSDLHVRIGGKRKRMEGSRGEGLRFWERRAGDEWVEVGV